MLSSCARLTARMLSVSGVFSRLGARLRQTAFIKVGNDLSYGRGNRSRKVLARQSHHLDGKVAGKLQQAVLLLNALALVFLRLPGRHEMRLLRGVLLVFTG